MARRRLCTLLLLGLLSACSGSGGGDGGAPGPDEGPGGDGGTGTPPSPPPVVILPDAYDIGSPVLTTLYIAPDGDDSNDGLRPERALRTLAEAWRRIPADVAGAATGYRLLLAPGTYAEASLPNYLERRHGSPERPILIAAEQPGTVVLAGDLNLFDVRHLYLLNLTIAPAPAGDAVHCEQCRHLLIRNCVLEGGGGAQETLKVNQSQHVYVENSRIGGAWDNAIDYVAVQYGHVTGTTVERAGDWCQYAKGGSAYLRFEANTYRQCGTGGFSAGQGTGFQFMTSPWLHYEAYGIRFQNNVVHDTEGAAVGANGAYNALFAHNTFYRVGTRSHLFEAVAGLRSCDGQLGDTGRERCQQYLDAGGWGTTVVDDGSNAVRIPNRDVLVFNNLFLNPDGVESRWQQFQIAGAMANPAASNVPADARGDTGLILRGNVIWNGPANLPLGIEDGSACADDHPTCSAARLTAENRINSLRPQLIDPANGDFRPLAGGNLDSLPAATIPPFDWSALPARPPAPAGATDTAVTRNRAGESRASRNRIGAF